MRTETSNTALHRPGIEHVVRLWNKSPRAIYNKITKQKTTKLNFDRIYQVSGFTAPTQFDQGDVVPEDEILTPYTMDRTPKLRGIRHGVSGLAAESDAALYKVIAGRKDMLGKAMLRGREEAVAAVFNNPTSTSVPYVLPDAKAMIATDHPLASGTQSNRGVASSDVDLSYSNLASMIQELAAQKDHRGGRQPSIGPFNLIVPPDLWELADQLALSSGRPGVANNDMNWTGKKIDVIMNPYITDADSFFVQDQEEHEMYFLLRKDTQVEMWEEPKTANSLWVAIWEAYTTYTANWRGLQGSPGA